MYRSSRPAPGVCRITTRHKRLNRTRHRRNGQRPLSPAPCGNRPMRATRLHGPPCPQLFLHNTCPYLGRVARVGHSLLQSAYGLAVAMPGVLPGQLEAHISSLKRPRRDCRSRVSARLVPPTAMSCWAMLSRMASHRWPLSRGSGGSRARLRPWVPAALSGYTVFGACPAEVLYRYTVCTCPLGAARMCALVPLRWPACWMRSARLKRHRLYWGASMASCASNHSRPFCGNGGGQIRYLRWLVPLPLSGRSGLIGSCFTALLGNAGADLAP